MWKPASPSSLDEALFTSFRQWMQEHLWSWVHFHWILKTVSSCISPLRSPWMVKSLPFFLKRLKTFIYLFHLTQNTKNYVHRSCFSHCPQDSMPLSLVTVTQPLRKTFFSQPNGTWLNQWPLKPLFIWAHCNAKCYLSWLEMKMLGSLI